MGSRADDENSGPAIRFEPPCRGGLSGVRRYQHDVRLLKKVFWGRYTSCNLGPPMHSIVYVSSAREPFTSFQLRELLDRACRNNEREKVTGLLLYREGSFMQLLEGPEATVERLFTSIRSDSRHWAVTPMLRSTGTQRMFPHWSMACRDLNDPEVLALPGFSQFLEPTISTREYFEKPTRAQSLLVYFKQSIF